MRAGRAQRRPHFFRPPPVTPRSGGGGGLLLREAFAAQDRAALRGAEGNGGFLAALGASGTSFHASVMASMFVAGRGGGGGGSYALLLVGFSLPLVVLYISVVGK